MRAARPAAPIGARTRPARSARPVRGWTRSRACARACARLGLAALLLALAACGGHGSSKADAAQPFAAAPVGLPASRAGQDVLGRDVSGLFPERWLGKPVAVGAADGPRATLVRFWTDSCPYCVRSLPVVEQLRLEFADAGLVTVGVYHPKPPRPVADDMVTQAASERGYHGPIAVDEDWEMLEALWLDGPRRAATSASFLLDADGVVRFVHPGPEFFESDDPAHALADADVDDLRQAVAALLADD